MGRGDPGGDGADGRGLRRAIEAPACYMRGSRIIVVRRAREGENPGTLLRERAEGLKRMAAHARAFLTGAPR